MKAAPPGARASVLPPVNDPTGIEPPAENTSYTSTPNRFNKGRGVEESSALDEFFATRTVPPAPAQLFGIQRSAEPKGLANI